jgi:hypothetical protein
MIAVLLCAPVPVDLSFRKVCNAGWHTSPHSVPEQCREVQVQGTVRPRTPSNKFSHHPASTESHLRPQWITLSSVEVWLQTCFLFSILSTTAEILLFTPEREVSLGWRWRARFYNAFRTSRQYSSSDVHVLERRRGELS